MRLLSQEFIPFQLCSSTQQTFKLSFLFWRPALYFINFSQNKIDDLDWIVNEKVDEKVLTTMITQIFNHVETKISSILSTYGWMCLMKSNLWGSCNFSPSKSHQNTSRPHFQLKISVLNYYIYTILISYLYYIVFILIRIRRYFSNNTWSWKHLYKYQHNSSTYKVKPNTNLHECLHVIIRLQVLQVLHFHIERLNLNEDEPSTKSTTIIVTWSSKWRCQKTPRVQTPSW